MATYLRPDLRIDKVPVPERTMAYYKRLIKRQVYEAVSLAFRRVSSANGQLSKTHLANRLGKDLSWVSRELSAPGKNWTLDTVIELLVGMGIDPSVMFAPLSKFEAALSEPPAAQLPEVPRHHQAEPQHSPPELPRRERISRRFMAPPSHSQSFVQQHF